MTRAKKPASRRDCAFRLLVSRTIPELVFTNEVDGYKGINYAEVSAVLVEAMKEQQRQIQDQQEEIDELKALVTSFISTN